MENVEIHHGDGTHVYAYVTFQDSKDAYFTLLAEEKKPNGAIRSLCPASSWKQPEWVDKYVSINKDTHCYELLVEEKKPNEAITESSSAPSAKQSQVKSEVSTPNAATASLLVLNDDCLLEVFKHCLQYDIIILWNVCQRFRNLLEEHELPKEYYKNYSITEQDEDRLLIQIRHDFQCFGQFIKNLTLEFKPISNIHERVLDLCSKYIGASLEYLSMDGFPIQSLRNRNLAPIWSKVKISKLTYDDEGEGLDIEMPNVENLQLHSFERNIPFLGRRWPKLTKLVLDAPYCNESHLFDCFAKNSQLKKLFLNLDEGIDFSMLRNMPKGLEQLTFMTSTFESGDDLLRLRKYRKLKMLGIIFCNYDMDGNTIDSELSTMDRIAIGNLRRFKYLRSIYLDGFDKDAFFDPDPIIIDISRDLPRLEEFYIHAYLEPEVIIEFIKNSPHLRKFSSAKHQTYDFVPRLAEIRKTYFENAPVLNLEFLISPPIINEIEAINEILSVNYFFIKYVHKSCRSTC